LRGPVRDFPLAVCDPTTVDASTDVLNVDSVGLAAVGEIWNLHHNPRQVWYYLSEQEPVEALLFRGFDSRNKNALGVPHCAFASTIDIQAQDYRESIEVRAVAFFD
jgi:hypothetical protein